MDIGREDKQPMPPRRGRLGLCRCGKCGVTHWDIVPEAYNAIERIQGKAYYKGPCDRCFCLSHPAADLTNYKRLRQRLGGE